LHEVKYKGKKELAVLLGLLFAPYLEDIKVDLIAPIPLHKSKLRRRTFNQSEQISYGISSELDVEVNPHLIQRVVATNSQTRKAKVERWQNMRNVYSEAQTLLSGKSVLVVDDVITTGATIGMFCQRLVEADVKEIHIASIARGK
ncbi:MAG: phosphoribosyltransferase family protein, partial [Ekhidna sp.]